MIYSVVQKLFRPGPKCFRFDQNFLDLGQKNNIQYWKVVLRSAQNHLDQTKYIRTLESRGGHISKKPPVDIN